MIAAGVIISYAMWIMLMSIAFWTTRVSELQEIFLNINELSRYPIDIFSGWTRIVLVFIAPVLITTNVPSQAFIGNMNLSLAAWLFIAAGGLLVCSRLVWNWGLQAYTSAGG